MELKSLPHFFNNKIYVVPDYQRGYSWAPKNVTDLLTDIDNAMKLCKPHYMGMIALHPHNKKVKVGVNNFTAFDVVDGQQRFTTLILILSYLLRELTKYGETAEDAQEKHKTYLRNKGTYLFRYAIDPVSDDYFRSVILEMEQKSSQEENLYTRNLFRAKKTIEDYFHNSNEPETLLDFLNAIEERLVFNEFLLTDGTEIGVVFETMNNRGVSLSNLEVAKNRLLYLTSKVPFNNETESELKSLSQLINKKWSHILKNLTLPTKVLSEDAFLSVHWTIYKGWIKDNAAKDDILERTFTIQKMLRDPHAMAEEIKKYIHSLAETSLVWRYINYPEDTKAFIEIKDLEVRSELTHTLSKLNRLANSTVRPIILAFHPLVSTHPEKLLEIARLAELFSFRLFSMNRRRSDTGKADLYRRAHRYHKQCGDPNIFKEALHILSYWIDEYGGKSRFEEEENELFASTKKHGFYSWGGLAYFMYEYEEELRAGNAIKVEYPFASQTNRSIEHVLPQTLNSTWKLVLQDQSKEQRKRLTHSLGNMLLICADKNSSLRNEAYSVKRDAYRTGSFGENKLAKEYSDWGPEEILKRDSQLRKFLRRRWRTNEEFTELYPWPYDEVEPAIDDSVEEFVDDTVEV